MVNLANGWLSSLAAGHLFSESHCRHFERKSLASGFFWMHWGYGGVSWFLSSLNIICSSLIGCHGLLPVNISLKYQINKFYYLFFKIIIFFTNHYASNTPDICIVSISIRVGRHHYFRCHKSYEKDFKFKKKWTKNKKIHQKYKPVVPNRPRANWDAGEIVCPSLLNLIDEPKSPSLRIVFLLSTVFRNIFWPLISRWMM